MSLNLFESKETLPRAYTHEGSNSAPANGRKRPAKGTILNERDAVSEIVGNIFILVITVSMFSGIFAFVYTLDVPEPVTSVDLRAELALGSVGGGYINITHQGGEVLKSGLISIIITINDTIHTLAISDSNSTDLSGATLWEPGDVWSRHFSGISLESEIVAYVYDMENAAVLLEALLLGREGDQAPIIGERGTNPDPVLIGGTFRVYAAITDPDNNLNESAIRVDLTLLGKGIVFMSLNPATGNYETTELSAPSNIIGTRTGVLHAADDDGYQTTSLISIRIGYASQGSPDLTVTSLEYSPINPTNGDTITFTAWVGNKGSTSADAKAMFYLDHVSNETFLGYSALSRAVGELDDVSIEWDSNVGGNHTIIVRLAEIYPPESDNEFTNFMEGYINILPSILIVDDDGYSYSDGSILDTAAYMEAALDAAGFERHSTYPVVPVGTDGPQYNIGDMNQRMSNYDIVIWMCGFENTTTLTPADRSNITRYLENNGSLWLIGNGVMDEAENDGWKNWMEEWIHVLNVGYTLNVPIPTRIVGNDTHNITRGPPLVRPLTTNPRGAGENTTDLPVTDGDPLTSNIFPEGGVGYGLAYGNESGIGSHVAFQAWPFTTILYPDDMGYLAYRVVLWLGNLSAMPGRDVSISEQKFDPPNPFFRQTVEISAVIRNNGVQNETVTYIFYLDGEEVYESKGTTGNLSADGGSTTVYWNWTADTIGHHVISVRADPDNKIPETNENNNEIDSRSVSKNLFVEYSILVVDDDRDASDRNVTQNVTDTLEALDYGYTYFDREVGIITPENLTLYNLVIWITGDTATDTLNTSDITALESYLDGEGKLWLISEGAMNEIGASTFASDYLKASISALDVGTPSPLEGVDFDDLTHGMEYATDSSLFAADGGDAISPIGDAEGIFWQDAGKTRYNAIRYDDNYSLVFFAFEYGFIYGGAASLEHRKELTYMVLRWMERPDLTPEIRTTAPDITVSSTHPVLGNSYIVGTTVYNHGDTAANALVRFMDGTTQIGAKTIPLEAEGYETIEIIWTPLFAGERTITVLTDPLNSVAEDFEWNNNATYDTEVYFFWDDMENGTGSWQHEDVLLRINGEGPYDYYYGKHNENTYTNISSDWYSISGVEINTSQYHTYDSSYHFEEDNVGISPPWTKVDVVLVIDNSANNTLQDLDWIKLAARNLVEDLPSGYRVAIFTYWTEDLPGGPQPGQPYMLQNFTWVNETLYGKTGWQYTVDNIYNNITNDGNASSPFINTTRTAIEHSENYTYPQHKKAVVAFLRGEFGPEFAGKEPVGLWTPETDPNDDMDGNDGNTVDDWAYGGITNAPMPIYTVRLCDLPCGEHDDVSNALNETAQSSDGTFYFTTDRTDIFSHFEDITTKILTQASGGSSRALGVGNTNKTAITESVDLSEAESATLRFFHKYSMLAGTNGAYIMVGYKDPGVGGADDWDWKYASPLNPYTGNLLLGSERTDDFGTNVIFGYTGVSDGGTFGWESAEFDLLSYVPESYRDRVRVMFNYTQYGAGTGLGWWVDDVEVTIDRGNSMVPGSENMDLWALTTTDAASGTHSWENTDPDTGHFKPSLDNVLVSGPIDLTNARNATLSGKVKFNINATSGYPPDGFRVEVSDDGGLTWQPLNDLQRAGLGLSGSGVDIGDETNDTGLDPAGDGWVALNTLSRMNVDLSGWLGNQIHIRFRVITNTQEGYEHHALGQDGERYGLLVDDIYVRGETIMG